MKIEKLKKEIKFFEDMGRKQLKISIGNLSYFYIKGEVEKNINKKD